MVAGLYLVSIVKQGKKEVSLEDRRRIESEKNRSLQDQREQATQIMLNHHSFVSLESAVTGFSNFYGVAKKCKIETL